MGTRGLAAIAAVIAVGLADAQAATLEVQVLGHDGKPLPQAVVFLESPAARTASRPRQNVEIVQANKRFDPVVTVVPVGTAVSFPNRDTVRHHVYSFSPAKTFELKLYVGTPAHPVVFDRPGVAVLGCNIHDQMAAWVVIVETPYHGQTRADGRVRLDKVPPGTYRLRSWHPALPVGAPALDQPLRLTAAGQTLTLRLPVSVDD